MNTTAKRKNEIAVSIANGKFLDEIVSPVELMALIADTDPVSFDKGQELLSQQLGANPGDMLDCSFDNDFNSDSLEAFRNTYFMDPVRTQINKYKYENALIADDELLAISTFLVSDSNLIESLMDEGTICSDEISNLIYQISARLKFLLKCFADDRYDVLNEVIRYSKIYKAYTVDTYMLLPKVEYDDGGVIDHICFMIGTKDMNPDYDNHYSSEAIAKILEKALSRGDNGNSTSQKNGEESLEATSEDNNEDDNEPLVERDFEG